MTLPCPQCVAPVSVEKDGDVVRCQMCEAVYEFWDEEVVDLTTGQTRKMPVLEPVSR